MMKPNSRVLVTGASGLIGSALADRLRQEGHDVVPLRRGRPETGAAWWDPKSEAIDLKGAGPIDAVVHLAGESIASYWTRAKKARIRESRLGGTRLLARALARLDTVPRVMVSASATGYYGDRGDAWLDESSAPGAGFLAELAVEWERATGPVAEAGTRVALLRTGIVLSSRGGALGRMLPLFRLGLGGRLGAGRHYWSWIVLEDAVRVILHTLHSGTVEGPVNNVAPHPVTNAAFTKVLGAVLRRPTLFPAPAFLLKAALGEMAEEVLLASARVRPGRLLESGFEFNWGGLQGALEHVLRGPGG